MCQFIKHCPVSERFVNIIHMFSDITEVQQPAQNIIWPLKWRRILSVGLLDSSFLTVMNKLSIEHFVLGITIYNQICIYNWLWYICMLLLKLSQRYKHSTTTPNTNLDADLGTICFLSRFFCIQTSDRTEREEGGRCLDILCFTATFVNKLS